MSATLSSVIAVPEHVPVHRTKRPSIFGLWPSARKKRGVRGWAEIGEATYECEWVPARNGNQGHWEFIDIPVEVVVVLSQQKMVESVETLPALVTAEGAFNVEVRFGHDLYNFPQTD